VAGERSGDDLLRGSLTESWRALDHFTDRLAAIRRLAGYLNDDPAPDSMPPWSRRRIWSIRWSGRRSHC
jgi:hypothetical protein